LYFFVAEVPHPVTFYTNYNMLRLGKVLDTTQIFIIYRRKQTLYGGWGI